MRLFLMILLLIVECIVALYVYVSLSAAVLATVSVIVLALVAFIVFLALMSMLIDGMTKHLLRVSELNW